MRHFISLSDVTPSEFGDIVALGLELSRCGNVERRSLDRHLIGIQFSVPSTRTRTAFTTASVKLGAVPLPYGPNDLQISTGETISDTGRILAGMLDALVVRTNGPQSEMRALAQQSKMAVINAMSDLEHPTQAVSDFVTLRQRFKSLNGIHLLYVGEGNNTAASLAMATALTPGMKSTFLTPPGYGLQADILQQCARTSASTDAVIREYHSVECMPNDADAVYTTRWQTMGVPRKKPNWRDDFEPFRVDATLMRNASRSGATFMHDLPAVRGEEVTAAVLDGSDSIAFKQAHNKVFGAMAVLLSCLQ
ncbi:ornithine carbamoyltransferase [Bradyrhizobium sp. ma5]|uniref:ornithine carbamoyltransferase n=1 Tax=Bradyrhizobium sp. ma5 TaxID=3344828 RepID=UPI0035D5214F